MSPRAELWRVSGGQEVRRGRTSRGVAPADPAVLPYWGSPVWRDEFDQPNGAPDPTKWNVRDDVVGDFGLLEDAAIVDGTLATVENGQLHLRARWLDTPQARTTSKWGISQITHRAAYIDHLDRNPGDMSFALPYFHAWIRMKTPTGPNTRGAMPAWWYRDGSSGSFTGSRGFTGSREHDTFEGIGYGGDMSAKAGYSYVQDTGKTTWFSNTSTGAGKQQYRWRDELGATVVPWDGFHDYTYTFMPTYCALAIDGVEVGRWTPAQLPQLWGTNPELHPMHVRLNLHVGEYFAQPDPANRALTQDPLDYVIDHYRVYAPPA